MSFEYCRLCAISFAVGSGIDFSTRQALNVKIERCTMISISKTDDLPTSICMSCCKMVHIISRFQSFCEKAQDLLKQMVAQTNVNSELKHPKDNHIDWTGEAELQLKRIVSMQKRDSIESIQNYLEEPYAAENEIKENDDSFIQCEVLENQKGYSCDWCYTFFKTESELHEHKNNERIVEKITNKIDSKAAEKAEEDKEQEGWKCCGHKYKLQATYAKHMKNVHNTEIETVKKKQTKLRRQTQCDICGKLITTNISQHKIFSHDVNVERCSFKECSGKIFRNRHRLQVHIRRVHTKIGHKKCDICGKMLNGWDKVKKHIKAVHQNVRPFDCQECDKAFHTQFNLNMHLRVHTGETNFRCSYCDKFFVYKHILKLHIEKEHLIVNAKMRRK